MEYQTDYREPPELSDVHLDETSLINYVLTQASQEYTSPKAQTPCNLAMLLSIIIFINSLRKITRVLGPLFLRVVSIERWLSLGRR